MSSEIEQPFSQIPETEDKRAHIHLKPNALKRREYIHEKSMLNGGYKVYSDPSCRLVPLVKVTTELSK